MSTKAQNNSSVVSIQTLETRTAAFLIRGVTPFIYNAMSEKTKHELFLPAPKMNEAERAIRLKHDPLTEYRNSVYSFIDDKHLTRLRFPASAFKRAMASAALETPGATKAQISRLVWVVGVDVEMYGIPQIFISQVRSGDIARTPDIRTRAILPEWAVKLSVSYAASRLTDVAIANLLSTAGTVIGVGDWRQEKGSGNYGQFEIADHRDESLIAFMNGCTHEAQDAALEKPAPYDDETERMLSWFLDEVASRKRNVPGISKNGRGQAPAVEVNA